VTIAKASLTILAINLCGKQVSEEGVVLQTKDFSFLTLLAHVSDDSLMITRS
jgi:hypothetical protein